MAIVDPNVPDGRMTSPAGWKNSGMAADREWVMGPLLDTRFRPPSEVFARTGICMSSRRSVSTGHVRPKLEPEQKRGPVF